MPFGRVLLEKETWLVAAGVLRMKTTLHQKQQSLT